MNITEYKLILTYDGTEMRKELTYRGNEDIEIRDKTQRPLMRDPDDQHAINIKVSRNILIHFLNLIEDRSCE